MGLIFISATILKFFTVLILTVDFFYIVFVRTLLDKGWFAPKKF
jgi:hypothetical protein